MTGLTYDAAAYLHSLADELDTNGVRTVRSLHAIADDYDRLLAEIKRLDQYSCETAMTEPTISSRGFKYMDPIPSVYGGHVAVYESSAASGPHLWVAVKQDRDARLDGRDTEATAHLTLDDAVRLRDQLTYLIENHYQVSGQR